jgi:hypothetical protein
MRWAINTFVISVVFISCAFFSSTSPYITVEDLQKHLSYIASDKLEGRRAGTKGAELAGDYIARQFKRFALEPVGDDGTYFQRFDFIADVKIKESSSASIIIDDRRVSLELGKDFLPFAFSGNGSISGEVVFVGYGITADSGYDDYKDIDVDGKVVIILKGIPDDDPHSKFGRYMSLRYKTSNAQSRRVGAIIFVNPPSEDDEFERFTYDYSFGTAGVPIIQVKRKFIEDIFRAKGLEFDSEVERIISKKSPNSMELDGIIIEINVELEFIKKEIANIVGFVKPDSWRGGEIIIIGAHYDHLGWGGQGSLVPDTVAIHNGADDNGSGTAGLLELAEIFSHRRDRLNRGILFIAFTAEEEGTLGSAYYVRNPIFPLDKTIAMINMDMIGRMVDNKLTIYGVGTSPVWSDLIERLNKEFNFKLNLIKDGYGPSDHAQFYLKNIPVLHFFTGIHSDYHRPSDDYDKINYLGQRRVLEFIYRLVIELDRVERKPEFVKVEEPRRRRVRGFRVYLGTVPDYSEQVEGLKISAVRSGSPAEKAGLRAGDIIVKVGSIEVKNIYDFTYALQMYKPGDEVEIIVLRDGERLSLVVKFESRK